MYKYMHVSRQWLARQQLKIYKLTLGSHHESRR